MVNFLTIGYDCSPAAALRNLGMRDFALPFDWVQSNIHCIQRCFEENFEKFHTNLRLDAKRTRVIDEYGFEFPHDYPLDESVSTDVIGTGVFGEEEGKTIVPTWENLCGLVRRNTTGAFSDSKR